MIILIAAVAENDVIADEHGIPWQGSLPRDVAFFRETTLGSTIVMGRSVHDELSGPLEGRVNLVLTHHPERVKEGFRAVASVDEAMGYIAKDDTLYVIGGGQVYRQFMPFADTLIVTRLEASFPGDVTFPVIGNSQWNFKNSDCYGADSLNAYSYCINTYERRSN